MTAILRVYLTKLETKKLDNLTLFYRTNRSRLIKRMIEDMNFDRHLEI